MLLLGLVGLLVGFVFIVWVCGGWVVFCCDFAFLFVVVGITGVGVVVLLFGFVVLWVCCLLGFVGGCVGCGGCVGFWFWGRVVWWVGWVCLGLGCVGVG